MALALVCGELSIDRQQRFGPVVCVLLKERTLLSFDRSCGFAEMLPQSI